MQGTYNTGTGESATDTLVGTSLFNSLPPNRLECRALQGYPRGTSGGYGGRNGWLRVQRLSLLRPPSSHPSCSSQAGTSRNEAGDSWAP